MSLYKSKIDYYIENKKIINYKTLKLFESIYLIRIF